MNIDAISKVTKIFQRDDGSEVKVVVTGQFGANIDMYAHRRESHAHEWVLLSDTPHPRWKSMSRDDYMAFGRSELFRHVTIGERLKLGSLIGQPMSALDALDNF